VVKVKFPVGRREDIVRLTLFHHLSVFACTSVYTVRARACQCVSAVHVLTSRNNHVNRAHESTVTDGSNARNMHSKLRTYTSYGNV
jgi:hypothetical protein